MSVFLRCLISGSTSRLVPSLITHLLLSFQLVLSEVYDLGWFTFYLSYRQHFISTDNHKSSASVIQGVARGSMKSIIIIRRPCLLTSSKPADANQQKKCISYVRSDTYPSLTSVQRIATYQIFTRMLFTPHPEPVHMACLPYTRRLARRRKH